MGTLGINLTAAEVNHLVSKYSVGAGLINYRGFIENVNHVFTEHADKKAIVQGAKSQAVSRY